MLHGSIPVFRSPAVSCGSSAATYICKCWATEGSLCILSFLCKSPSRGGPQAAVSTAAQESRGAGCSPTPVIACPGTATARTGHSCHRIHPQHRAGTGALEKTQLLLPVPLQQPQLQRLRSRRSFLHGEAPRRRSHLRIPWSPFELTHLGTRNGNQPLAELLSAAD